MARGKPGSVTSLEQLEAQYSAATTPGARKALRSRARQAAVALGQEVPTWAAAPVSLPLEAKPTKAPRAPRTPKPEARPPAPPAEPIELPDCLRQWRQAAPGRVVNVRRDGSVRLLAFNDNGGSHREAAFADVRTAERAMLLGIEWRPMRATTAEKRKRQGDWSGKRSAVAG